MNGRIYDPKLGRMLQADPFIQSPTNSQSLNRYSYVLNNPLSYTDPSGYFSFSRFIKKWGRTIIAAVATYVTWGAASGWAATFAWGSTMGTTATLTFAGGAVAGAITGAVGGAILTGTLKGAFYGALSGAALGGIGATGWSNTTKSLASGAASGVTTELQGGKFGHGFLSAGLGFWSGLKFGGAPNFGKFLASAIAGGTISELTGGKFGNGAVTAAMSYSVTASIGSGGGGNSSHTQLSGMSKVLSTVGNVAGKIWALPNTIIGAVYGGIGMLFGATPVWDGNAGILRFTNMPEWMMPTAMSFGHVQIFGPGAFKNPDGSFALNRFGVPVVTEETLHTRQAEILGPLYLPLHGIGMGTSLITGGGTHDNNFLEMGPEHGRGPWPWSN